MGKFFVAVAFSLMLAACAYNPPPQFDPAAYPTVYRAFDLTFFWRTDRAPDVLTISGFLKNGIHPKIRDIEVSAVFLNSAGKEEGKEVVDFVLHDVEMDDLAYFSLPLPLTGMGDPQRARLYYRYNLVERESGVLPQYHSFELPLD